MFSLIMIIVGGFFIIEGIPYIAFPKKAKEWASNVQEIPDRTLRIIGIISIITGIVFIYSNQLFLIAGMP